MPAMCFVSTEAMEGVWGRHENGELTRGVQRLLFHQLAPRFHPC